MFICLNGDLTDHPTAVALATNRSFRYGDGLFETMRLVNGSIALDDYHFERLFNSLSLLKINAPHFNADYLTNKIIELAASNNCEALARVRLHVYRTDQNMAAYIIECMAMQQETIEWKEFTIDIYPYARKSADAFSPIKSANYLPYVMASLYAEENKTDESIVLNHLGKLCDASKANIFLIRNGDILTPALHQGCVNGVMRRHVMQYFKEYGTPVKQTELTEEDLYTADEVFLTNALYGIRGVCQFRERAYLTKKGKWLYDELMG